MQRIVEVEVEVAAPAVQGFARGRRRGQRTARVWGEPNEAKRAFRVSQKADKGIEMEILREPEGMERQRG